MGRPSKRRRSAQRPGKRERTRVNNRKALHGVRRGGLSFNLPGAGYVHVKAGRKKMARVVTWSIRVQDAHLSGRRLNHESESQVADGQDKQQPDTAIPATASR